ncbi:hypothetical protein EAE96_005177 [Botrytis aclada]|nr:hypothetical protein EAE96_005177 [Botrytis aclada]
MRNTNYVQQIDGNMTSEQQIQDNQKFLEQVYLHPLAQYQSSNYVDPSRVMYDRRNPRWIDPSPEAISQNTELDEEYNHPLPNQNNSTTSYPDVPELNRPAEPYHAQNNLSREESPVLAQNASFGASNAPSGSATGQPNTVNNYNNNHATAIGDQSHGIQSLIDRNNQDTQTENLNADDQSDSSNSEAPETSKSKNKGAAKKKRKPWTERAEFTFSRVWMTEQEMKLIDPEYEKNPRLAFKDMTNAKNGMKSFQIDWDQVQLLNEHRRKAAREENERAKRSTPGEYVQKFVPKPYIPDGRLRKCRDEWFKKKQMGEVSDSWTNRKRRMADHTRYNPEAEDDSIQ